MKIKEYFGGMVSPEESASFSEQQKVCEHLTSGIRQTGKDIYDLFVGTPLEVDRFLMA